MKEYLYHGSPYRYDILIPNQAFDIGFEAGCQLAVYATSNRNMALCFALGCVADSEKEVERTMMPEYGDKMLFKMGIRIMVEKDIYTSSISLNSPMPWELNGSVMRKLSRKK